MAFGVPMMARWQPVSRRCRASARVSTPAIAGTPARAQDVDDLAGAAEHRGRGVRHHEAAQPGPLRLVVAGQPTVVADQRVGHDHDLAGVRGVRADLLVAGLARVDDQVTTRCDRRAERDAMEDGSILEREQGRSIGTDARIDDRVEGDGNRAHGLADTERPPPAEGRWSMDDRFTYEASLPASLGHSPVSRGRHIQGRLQGNSGGPASRRSQRCASVKPRSPGRPGRPRSEARRRCSRRRPDR